MRSQIYFAVLLIFANFCTLPSSAYLATRLQQDAIVLAEGTPIRVVTTQDINSKEAKPNDAVKFTVDEDVSVNGQVVVRKGTAAAGSVINAEKGGYLAKYGQLTI